MVFGLNFSNGLIFNEIYDTLELMFSFPLINMVSVEKNSLLSFLLILTVHHCLLVVASWFQFRVLNSLKLLILYSLVDEWLIWNILFRIQLKPLPFQWGPWARCFYLPTSVSHTRIMPARTSPKLTRSASNAEGPGLYDLKWATGRALVVVGPEQCVKRAMQTLNGGESGNEWNVTIMVDLMIKGKSIIYEDIVDGKKTYNHINWRTVSG